MKVGIIGAGWYGCHIGLSLLNSNVNVKVFEKNSNIFGGASGINTGRLHQGFHYPRSKSTRIDIAKNYSLFLKVYSNFLFTKINNLYCISSENSLLDWGTYIDILKSDNLSYNIVSKENFGIQNVEGVLNCSERYINFKKASDFFLEKLRDKIQFNFNVNSVELKNDKVYINETEEFDFVINCSYAGFYPMNNLDIKHEIIQIPLFEYVGTKPDFSIVFMDGNLFSLTPYLNSQSCLYTLYDVELSSVFCSNNLNELEYFMKNVDPSNISINKNEIFDKVNHYLPSFDKNFKFTKNIFSKRSVLNRLDANREIYYNLSDRYLNIFSGKISSVFTAEKIVKEEILKICI